MSDHEAVIRAALTCYVPDGFRDEDGVWHQGPHRVGTLAALDALAAEAEEARAEYLDAAQLLNAECVRADALAAEVRQLREALEQIAGKPVASAYGVVLMATEARKIARAALAAEAAR